MCEYHEQLQRISHEFDLMRGTGVYDMPRLKNLLNQALQHEEGHQQ